MFEAQFTAGKQQVAIDVCRRCQFLWFDGGEFSPDTPRKPPAKGEQLPAKAREAYAIAEAEQIGRRGDAAIQRDLPSEPWQLVVAFLGMPVEQNEAELRRFGGCLMGVAFWFWSCRTSRLAGSKSRATVD
jgi:Zn-finger nucleic acid-binding protein